MLPLTRSRGRQRFFGGGWNPFSQLGPTLDLSFAGVVTDLTDPNGYTLNTNFIAPQYQIAAQYVVWETNVGLVDKTFSQIITFTRASTGTFFDSAGVLQSAAIDAPRLDYNPSTLAALGLLIEEQRTNLLLQSADFATTWTVGFTTIAANATASPDGGTNGDKLQETAVTNEHYIRQFLTGLTTNTTYTVSVFVKASERTRFRIRILDTDNVANGYFADYNLTTVAANGSGSGAGSITGTPSITSVGNGWFRCVVSGNASTGTKYIVDFFLLNAAGAANYLGVAGEGLFLWGAQCELGSFSTSYIPTTTTALTRNQDRAVINTLAPWYNATTGTIYAEFAVTQPASGVNQFLARFSDNSYNNQIGDFVSSTGFVGISTASGGVFDGLATTAVVVSANTITKAAGAYAANDLAAVKDGGAVATDNTATIPSGLIRFDLGSDHGGLNNIKAGYLRRITYYPRRLSNAELVSITTP